MKIKLINPRFHSRYFWDFKKLSALLGRRANTLLLALPTLAALTPEEHDVSIVDDNIEAIDYDEPVDLVGITAMTSYANRAFEIAHQFRRRRVPVVFGGPHATLAPHETLDHCDAVVIGEAENVWQQLLTDLGNCQMKEVYRGVDARPTLKTPRTPAWKAYRANEYLFYGVEATRGCPFDCSFCSIRQVYGEGVRTRDVADILREIESAPNNQIFFTDDNLIGDKTLATELFTQMKGLNIAWGCQMSVNVAAIPGMLELMKESGCFFIFIGLETLNEKTVEDIKKPVNRVEYKAATQRIQGLGIHVIGSFILGFDADTSDSFDDLYEFVQESKLSWVMLNLINSPPGTDLMRQLESEGRIRVYSLDELDGTHSTVVHPSMTREQIEDGLRRLYRRIYDWKAMRERLTWSLDNGHWNQNAMTLSLFEQVRVMARLFCEYVIRGSKAQRRFFWSVFRRWGRTANKESIVNVLLLAVNWNEFAHALRPSLREETEPIRMLKEYTVPVAEQRIGLDGRTWGAGREGERLVRPPDRRRHFEAVHE